MRTRSSSCEMTFSYWEIELLKINIPEWCCCFVLSIICLFGVYVLLFLHVYCYQFTSLTHLTKCGNYVAILMNLSSGFASSYMAGDAIPSPNTLGCQKIVGEFYLCWKIFVPKCQIWQWNLHFIQIKGKIRILSTHNFLFGICNCLSENLQLSAFLTHNSVGLYPLLGKWKAWRTKIGMNNPQGRSIRCTSFLCDGQGRVAQFRQMAS